MCAKKTTKKPKSARQDATPSKEQKPAQVIELSSDSNSDVSSTGGNGEKQEQQQQPLATPATKRKAPEDAAGEDGDAPASSSASKRQRKLAVRVKQGEASGGAAGEAGKGGEGVVVRKTHLEISAPAAALSSSVRKPMEASTHVRFGDEDDDSNDKFFTPMERPTNKNLFDAAAKKAQGVEEEKDDDEAESELDDDAPPEAVSSHAAAHQVNDLVKQAAKAAEQQAASERLKRQRRDALFKTQARKRALDEAESPAAPKPAPALLPAEFLESDDESDADDDGESRKVEARKPKKIKFETAERRSARQEGRGVADRRDGDTVYKVVRPVADTRLAPRASKRTAFDKKKLLSRGRVEVRKKGGFLLK
ncbi:hypothetical protein PpBr36_09024 [Pyricularia pennisetigena]|uniref:hypothetical protein n=1 Tax=Pyricularia pennisetigena TaxID=1578925 RepID=UPI001150D79A|nr:hypothetical protein PpBr36_09024 [Pyricularia pennisetigena]TLS24443.1 hypothetical protein PpBr36_09024 [Pyricularia pennisetigena]